MSEKAMAYKYCIVPMCTNTTTKTPNKYFFHVPRDKVLRKKWCKAMKRYDKRPLSNQTCLHCCEDHFQVDTDVENYIKYKLVGGRMKLKKGILPHRFDCQRALKKVKPRSVIAKRRKIELLNNLLARNFDEPEQSIQPIKFVSCGNINVEEADDQKYVFYDEKNYESSSKIRARGEGAQVNFLGEECDNILCKIVKVEIL